MNAVRVTSLATAVCTATPHLRGRPSLACQLAFVVANLFVPMPERYPKRRFRMWGKLRRNLNARLIVYAACGLVEPSHLSSVSLTTATTVLGAWWNDVPLRGYGLAWDLAVVVGTVANHEWFAALALCTHLFMCFVLEVYPKEYRE
jgi:hypothetical protein